MWDGGGWKSKLDKHSINTGENEQAGWLAGPFSQGGPSVWDLLVGGHLEQLQVLGCKMVTLHTAFLFKDIRACKNLHKLSVWSHQLEVQVIAFVLNLPANDFNKFLYESVWHSPLTVLSGSYCSSFLSVAKTKRSY